MVVQGLRAHSSSYQTGSKFGRWAKPVRKYIGRFALTRYIVII